MVKSCPCGTSYEKEDGPSPRIGKLYVIYGKKSHFYKVLRFSDADKTDEATFVISPLKCK
jgi:hypothetical protein